ncbi:MAG TPA: PEGA domain-containing protein [Nitrospiraceae bacterium]|nr:PEGA domain-containing protein [Nitrospiraceae bacterium]
MNLPWPFMIRRVRLIVHSVLTVSLVVFLALGCQQREFTLVVIGEDDTDGAGVFINGRSVGMMVKEGEQRPQFSTILPKGTLTVEVKKDGYLPFLEVITVTSQISEQMYVKLARDTISEEKSPDAETDLSRRAPASPTSKLPVCPD